MHSSIPSQLLCTLPRPCPLQVCREGLGIGALVLGTGLPVTDNELKLTVLQGRRKTSLPFGPTQIYYYPTLRTVRVSITGRAVEARRVKATPVPACFPGDWDAYLSSPAAGD